MRVSVLGLGYVGSVAAAGIAASGHHVLGIDVDRDKVAAFRGGELPLYEPGLSQLIKDAQENGRLRILHTDEVREPLGDAMLITAGTPTTSTGAADLSQVRSAISWINESQSQGGVAVCEAWLR